MRFPTSRPSRSSRLVLAVAAVGLAVATVGAAAPAGAIVPVTITNYTQGISGAGQVPGTIAAGPDGNVWFTEYAQDRFARITPTGVVTTFDLPKGHHPYGITGGPDGNLWITVNASILDAQACSFVGGEDYVAKVSTSGQVLATFPTPAPHRKPSAITVGPDGALWFAESGWLCISPQIIGGAGIGRVTTDGQMSEITAGIPQQSGPAALAFGADGRAWFTTLYDSVVGATTTGGQVTLYDLPFGQFGSGITGGSDGNVWLTINRSDPQIGRVTPTGTFTFFKAGLPDAFDVWDITTGPDGQLWFVGGDSGFGQITTAGAITMVPGLPGQSQPAAITNGPAGSNTLWIAGDSSISRALLDIPPTTTTSTTSTTTAPTTSTTTPSAVVTPAFTG